MRAVRIAASIAVTSIALLALSGCPGEEAAPRCTTPPPASCAPLYEPTYEQIFTRTLAPSCALSGASCHAAEGRQGGLAFANVDESYDLLVSSGKVRAGDPSCSEMMVRLLAADPIERMPPGRALDPGAQCAIRTWIANGARR